ncbi:hypothetical protein BJF78_34840 [Pseudonocardia sp. CNS-139]|nr:hypothetical protein BJF78_34840 [Pseudonocardia sp. CNS-139]
MEHQPSPPAHRDAAVPVILPSGETMFALPPEVCVQVPPSLAQPVPITSVGGTGLPSASVLAPWYFATPTTPQEPTPPEQRTWPWPVSCPFGDAASMSRLA